MREQVRGSVLANELVATLVPLHPRRGIGVERTPSPLNAPAVEIAPLPPPSTGASRVATSWTDARLLQLEWPCRGPVSPALSDQE